MKRVIKHPYHPCE
uniref:Uncharacterized protein n=1 Tax=Anguilla anguilla TaxID=7936 RepID=A0A0E9QXW4_ANGAN